MRPAQLGCGTRPAGTVSQAGRQSCGPSRQDVQVEAWGHGKRPWRWKASTSALALCQGCCVHRAQEEQDEACKDRVNASHTSEETDRRRPSEVGWTRFCVGGCRPMSFRLPSAGRVPEQDRARLRLWLLSFQSLSTH